MDSNAVFDGANTVICSSAVNLSVKPDFFTKSLKVLKIKKFTVVIYMIRRVLMLSKTFHGSYFKLTDEPTRYL
jgi:hypothetical protein